MPEPLRIGQAEPIPPSLLNVEAEAALLGGMMLANKRIDYVLDRLRGEDLTEPAHRVIFEALRHQHSLGRPANAVTIRPLIEAHPALEQLGGVAYPAKLAGSSAALIALDGLVDQLRDLARLRRMLAGLDTARGKILSEDSDDIEQIVAACDTALTEAAGTQTGPRELTGADCIREALSEVDEGQGGVTCGSIPSLDRLLGDLRPGNIVVVGARPSQGKTATALTYAIGAARKGHGTLFVSLEMSALELGQRMAAEMCFDDPGGISLDLIRNRRLGLTDRRQVEDVVNELDQLPLRIVDAATLTIGRLNMLVRRHKRRMEAAGQSLQLVVVDYLQLLSPDGKSDSQYQAVSEISRGLKALAKEHDVAVMALAQLNRQVEARQDKRPMQSDLRDSGQIEQDADAIVLLFRAEHYLLSAKPHGDDAELTKWQETLERCHGLIEFIVPKCRNGRVGTATGQFHGQFQAVRG